MKNCFITLKLLIKTNKYCVITSTVEPCPQLSISGVLPTVVVITNDT